MSAEGPGASATSPKLIKLGEEQAEAIEEISTTEFPISLLSERESKEKTVEFKSIALLPDGTEVQRRLIVSGSDAYGLPTSGDEPVWLSVLSIAKEQGFRSRTIRVGMSELLTRMGLTNTGANRDRLSRAIWRLATTTLVVENLYRESADANPLKTFTFHLLQNTTVEMPWDIKRDPKTKQPVLDEKGRPIRVMRERKDPGEVAKGPRGGQVAITVSEEVWDAILGGSAKALRFGTYLSLEDATSRRLYRFLDLRRAEGVNPFSIGLSVLAFEHLGVPRGTKRAKFMPGLERAHEKLVEIGLLEKVRISEERRGSDHEVTYTFGVADAEYDELLTMLTSRGVWPKVARDLIRDHRDIVRQQVDRYDQYGKRKSVKLLVDSIKKGYNLLEGMQPNLFASAQPSGVAAQKVVAAPDEEPTVLGAPRSEELDMALADLGDDELDALRERAVSAIYGARRDPADFAELGKAHELAKSRVRAKMVELRAADQGSGS